MNNNKNENFGSPFERIFVSLLAVASGLMLIFLALEGPLWLNHIKYKTAPVIYNQILGQDLVNLFILSIVLIVGGITLYFRKRISKYLLIMTPFYLIYFVLSYTLGIEWSSPTYTGNSEHYTYHFLFVLVSSVIILLYSLSVFPKNFKSDFNKNGLIMYTVVYTIFMLLFALNWVKETNLALKTGELMSYMIAPAAFWTIKFFDLGFSIPLGLISIYLLWTRPDNSFHIQLLFYGFFITMLLAVNSMAFVMYLYNDPTFSFHVVIVFIILAVIIFSGFVYILNNYKRIEK